MIEYRDYIKHLNRLNITEENGKLLLNFLEALALIGIEYQENNELKKELRNDKELLYMDSCKY